MSNYPAKPMIGFVRDKNTGLPKFDNPDRVPEAMKAALTDDDLARLDPDIVRRLGMDNSETVRQIRGRYQLNKPI